MNSKDFFILIVIFVMLFAALFGTPIKAQKVMVDKKVEIISHANKPDSTVVVVKKVKSNQHIPNSDGPNIDSLIQVLCTRIDSNEEQMIKIMTIHNGDTTIDERHADSFDPLLFQDFNLGNIEEGMFKSLQQFDYQRDSLFHWSTHFDSLIDPLNIKSFDMELVGNRNDMDSIMEQHFRFNGNDTGKQMILLSENGDEIRIERNGEVVFINKNEGLDSVDSDIKVIKNGDGKKVIVLQTRIQLDELTEGEKSDLKSKGLKTSSKEPEFDYLKFYPNPSEGAVNIQFRTAKPADTEVRITNMLGKILYEEKLNNFSGEYNKTINLSDNGAETYLLQIVQGKKVITRKIIVD